MLGESGSGKSVTLRSILRLHPPRRTVMTGAIRVGGEDVLAESESEMEDLRGGRVAMIFQEPMLALDPVYTLGQQIVETIRPPRERLARPTRMPARWRCSSGCAFPRPSGGWPPTRTRCRAACASGR